MSKTQISSERIKRVYFKNMEKIRAVHQLLELPLSRLNGTGLPDLRPLIDCISKAKEELSDLAAKYGFNEFNLDLLKEKAVRLMNLERDLRTKYNSDELTELVISINKEVAERTASINKKAAEANGLFSKEKTEIIEEHFSWKDDV